MTNHFKLIVFFVLISVSFVHAQEITVFPGLWNMEYYEDENKITKTELESILSANQESLTLWQEAKSKQTLGYVFFAAEVGFGTWTAIKLMDDEEEALVPGIATIGTGIVAMIFLNSANKKKKEAILKYNSSLDKKVSFDLNIDSDGLGFVLSF